MRYVSAPICSESPATRKSIVDAGTWLGRFVAVARKRATLPMTMRGCRGRKIAWRDVELEVRRSLSS
jgi:hypothetical protein